MIEITPCPPLLCVGKSSKLVFLPYPFSDTQRIVFRGSATLREISFWSFFNFIPLTPRAVLPIGLTLDSLNLINFPAEEASKISLVPSVMAVPINLSSSSKFIALMPDFHFRSNRLKLVFFVIPLLVAIKIKCLSENSSTGSISLTLSSSSRFNILTKGLPLEVLDATGIS